MPSPTPTLGLERHLTNILSISSGSHKAYPLVITTRCSLELYDSTKIQFSGQTGITNASELPLLLVRRVARMLASCC